MSRSQVKASGAEYNVGTFPFAANSRARTNDDSEGLVKFISCKHTDKILGAHIVGPNAGELLGDPGGVRGGEIRAHTATSSAPSGSRTAMAGRMSTSRASTSASLR